MSGLGCHSYVVTYIYQEVLVCAANALNFSCVHFQSLSCQCYSLAEAEVHIVSFCEIFECSHLG